MKQFSQKRTRKGEIKKVNQKESLSYKKRQT